MIQNLFSNLGCKTKPTRKHHNFRPRHKCQFPFTYNNITYHKCTDAYLIDDDIDTYMTPYHWCATKSALDDNNNTVLRNLSVEEGWDVWNFGECNEYCPRYGTLAYIILNPLL